ncbi:MAG: hypothetical protein M5U18_04415 [Dehalococcoidia bacterium]|nr:hypothetical protein [Dehalococcoidia bacterium]
MDGLSVRWFVMGGLLAMVVAACGGEDAEPTATATAPMPTSTPTVPQPTATPDPEAEVLAAYARYWDVYTEALRNRDDSRLDEVMTGPRLQRGLQEIADLRAEGRAIQLVVQPNPVVLEISEDFALVSDEYENNSYYIDPVTKQPVGATPVGSETLIDLTTLQRVGGVWKVSDGVREETSQ